MVRKSSKGGYSKTRKLRSYSERQNKRKKHLVVFFVILAIFFIYLLLNAFILTTYRVSTATMEPSIPQDCRVFSLRSYGAELPFTEKKMGGGRMPERGEVVVLRPPFYTPNNLLQRLSFPFIRFVTGQMVSADSRREEWDTSLTVLRVIGLPGDSVKMNDYVFYIKPSGEEFFLTEFERTSASYDPLYPVLSQSWDSSFPLSGEMQEVKVGENQVFLAADNRSATGDSRYWGSQPVSSLMAHLVFIYWPFTVVSKL